MRSGAMDVVGMGTMPTIHMHDYSIQYIYDYSIYNGRAEAHAILSTSL